MAQAVEKVIVYKVGDTVYARQIAQLQDDTMIPAGTAGLVSKVHLTDCEVIWEFGKVDNITNTPHAWIQKQPVPHEKAKYRYQ